MTDTVLRTWPMANGGFIARFVGRGLPWQATVTGTGMTRDDARRDLVRSIPREVLSASPVSPFQIDDCDTVYPV